MVPPIREANRIDAEFESAAAPETALGVHLSDAPERDSAFRDDHVILVDDGFGDFEIDRFVDVCVS